ncbi:hypothetical protein BIY23_02195 [Wolbachia pipientis]|uniref:Uncharacterized protein n=1 Tax=Wolbachia pipientis TaxID=955 RepID=A0A1E7QKT1_WOLPI|nr:hypothetical protein BIY23_02195 [Wolbachia pipientis]
MGILFFVDDKLLLALLIPLAKEEIAKIGGHAGQTLFKYMYYFFFIWYLLCGFLIFHYMAVNNPKLKKINLGIKSLIKNALNYCTCP